MKEFFSSLYIHIPFCIRKCKYCDFYSLIYDTALEKIFIESLLREMEMTAEKPHCIETIYIGGGTPNCLSPHAWEKILRKLMKTYRISENFEFTVELNPALIDERIIAIFKDFSVNRLSIGIQSFVDRELKTLGRLHSSEEALKTVNFLSKKGFENLSIDLIYSIPGQTVDSFLSSLSIATSLEIKHISIYELTLSRETELYREIERGIIKGLDEEQTEKLYLTGSNFLEQRGFFKYEISNFAKESYECKHNLAYWLRKPYLGLGPSAHSFIGNRRVYNPSDLFLYAKELEQKRLAWKTDRVLSEEDKIIESLILRLRLKEGVEIKSNCLLNFLRNFESHGLTETQETRVSLTDRGMLLSNEIFVQVLLHIENCPLCKEELKGLYLQTG